MAFYRYYCEKNETTIEVAHPMTMRLKTWGEVCAQADKDPGTTPLKTPVVRLMGAIPMIHKTKGLDKDQPSSRLEL